MPQIDYAKLATETGLKDAKSASAVWGPLKKKLFGIASAQSGAVGGTANKITKPKTPRKPKEPKTPKTPASSTKKVAHSAVTVEEQEDEAASDEDPHTNESGVKVEVNMTNGAVSSPPPNVETNNDQEPAPKDGHGDYAMGDALEPLDKGKGKVSIADEMSSGDMSPPTTPAPTKPKKTATPKAKLAAKTPKTPKTPAGEAANTSPGNATETPATISPSAKKRGRKTKAQKEAEAAAAGENGAIGNDEEEDGEKSAKKARMTAVKKAKKGVGVKDGEAAGAVEDEHVEETPVKKSRKTPVKKAKNDAGAENRDGNKADTNNGEDRQTDTLMKKPRKTPVKKGKKEEAAPVSESSTAVDAVKQKKKAGPQPGAVKAKKAATVVLPTEPDAAGEKEAEQEKIDREAAAKLIEAVELANEVLGGKKIATKTARYVQLLSYHRLD